MHHDLVKKPGLWVVFHDSHEVNTHTSVNSGVKGDDDWRGPHVEQVHNVSK